MTYQDTRNLLLVNVPGRSDRVFVKHGLVRQLVKTLGARVQAFYSQICWATTNVKTTKENLEVAR
jgi:hypothetical protein